MRFLFLLPVILLLLLAACTTAPAGEQEVSPRVANLSLKKQAYFRPYGTQVYDSLPPGTSFSYQDSIPVELGIAHVGFVAFYQLLWPIELVDGRNGQLIVADENEAIKGEGLDSISMVAQASFLLSDRDLFRRWKAYRAAVLGQLDRPPFFLFSEGLRLARAFSRPGATPAEDYARLQIHQQLIAKEEVLLPGFTYVVDRGYWLNFKYWSAQTDDEAAQQFLTTWQSSYQGDSLGDPGQRSWLFPRLSGGMHSNLGNGATYQYLLEMERLAGVEASCYHLAAKLATATLEFPTANGTTFWQERDALIGEIDSLLQREWTIIKPYQLIALEALKSQIIATDTSGIRLGYRSGYFDE